MHAPSSETYLVLDADNTPTGEVAPVAGTKFDFRTPKKLGDETTGPFTGFDQFWVSSDTSPLDGEERVLATITSPADEGGPGVEMTVSSNQPGFQMYTANGSDGSGAGCFEQYGSVAVEPSGYIDAENHDNFPTTVLEPGETRAQRMTFQFRMVEG